jgi:hypothetical protein
MAETSPFDAALWSATAGPVPENIRTLVPKLATETQSKVTVWVLITPSGNGSEPATARLARMPGVTATRWAGGGGLFFCEDPAGAYVFGALDTQHEGVITLISSLSSSDDRWRRLRRWVARRRSMLSPILLNEADFLALGDALAAHGPVLASRLTARALSDWSSYTRGWPEKRRAPRPSHREALAEAHRLAVRTLTVHVGDRLLVQLRRDAGATYYSGEFSLFEKVVVAGLVRAAAERRDLLRDRERRRNAPTPRPLAVRTRGDTFGAAEAIFELLDVLERQPDTGVAVFHRNPYLHATITDYSDGSNFDLFVNHSDEVVVIPGYKASLGALARVTDVVGERFAAVEVTELAPLSPPTMSDFLGDG